MTQLPEFLRDDLRRCLPVEEEVADHLTNNTIGASIIGLGAGLFTLECGRTPGHEGVEQLMKTLSRVAVFVGRLFRAEAFALAFIEHGELASDFIISRDGYFAGRSREDRLVFTKD